ncbi:tetratricopeptide repeat protein [Myxococcus stipitatus]|uniref:tetratricopeptide repeat protein n=1 Tax=Myxococcus stipitatus TaxID=83455 RepID=UPI003144FFE3
MTKYRRIFACGVVLALALSGGVFAQPSGPEDPDVDLGIVTAGEGGTYRGWPIVIEISIAHPKADLAAIKGETVQPLVVAVPSGRWTTLVKLVIRNAQGDIQPWPYRLLTTVGSSLTLDVESRGGLTVVLSPEAMAVPTVGRYSVEVFLDSRNGTTAASWKGVSSSRLEFDLKDVPTTPSNGLACKKGYVFSEYHSALGQLSAASSALDTALAQAPDELVCLVERAELAERQGNTHDAIDFYQRAMEAKAQLPQEAGGESSSGSLLHRCLELVKKLPASERHPLGIFCAYVTCEERTDGGTCPAPAKSAPAVPKRGARTGARMDGKAQ